MDDGTLSITEASMVVPPARKLQFNYRDDEDEDDQDLDDADGYAQNDESCSAPGSSAS